MGRCGTRFLAFFGGSHNCLALHIAQASQSFPKLIHVVCIDFQTGDIDSNAPRKEEETLILEVLAGGGKV